MDAVTAFRSVAGDVRKLYTELIDKAACVHVATNSIPVTSGDVWISRDGRHCWVDKYAEDANYSKLEYLFDTVTINPERQPASGILIKTASLNSAMTSLNSLYSVPSNMVGKVMGAGGATPLTDALTSGAINAGLGYGAGHLWNRYLAKPLHRMNPERFSGQTIAPTAFATIGGIAGAAPGLVRGLVNTQAKSNIGQELTWRDYIGMGRFGYNPISETNPELTPGFRDAIRNKIDGTPNPEYQRGISNITKQSAYGMPSSQSGLFAPAIPVDAFNNAVWAPWMQSNPFGTKNTFGDDREETLAAPAALSGLVGGASAMKGGTNVVSVADIARMAGYGAAGWTAGQIAGALVGLKPEARHTLTRNGVIGGLVVGATKALGLM